MILVIDGYNLLNEMYRHKLVSEKQLRFFLKKISDYSLIKDHQVTLVFDGYNNFDIYSQEYKNVSLYFSKNISADDYIKDYIHINRFKDLAVVSSDLEIYRNAVSLGIVTIKSSAFLYLMNKAEAPLESQEQKSSKTIAIKLKGQIHKISEDENPELDKLMSELSDVAYYKVEEKAQERNEQESKKKLSKSEKKILTVRKKL